MAKMSDCKHSLRKLDFPYCAREALIEIEHLISGRSAPTSKQYDLAIDLVAEFIFNEYDRRSSRKSLGLTSFQELQLLSLFIDYFSEPINDNVKSKVFLLIFDRSVIHKRTKILCKLASLAIAASKPQVLKLIGACSQITNCSIVLAKTIIQDHFVLQSNNEPLKILPNIAPSFITDILAAIVQIHMKDGTRDVFSPPPLSLLETITHWVYSNPRLCLCEQESVSGSSSSSIIQISPLGGLAQWCVLSPLYIITKDTEVDLTESEPQIKKIKKENVDVDMTTKKHFNTREEMLYAKLHLGVLQSLHEAKARKTPPLINAQQIVDLIGQLNKKFAEITKHKKNGSENQHIQTSLDRLAQTLQICLACGSLNGNIASIFSQINSLPECKMLKIVAKHYNK